MSWVDIPISEIGRVVTGDTPPRKQPELYGDAYPFIKPTDMTIGQRHTFEYEEGYSAEGASRYRNKLIPAGSTAVVTIGSIGQKLTLTHTDCFVNQAVNAVIPDKTRFDYLYVFYLLRHNLTIIKQADTGASSGRENVSKSNFSSLRITVTLDKNVQKHIGEILGRYDDLIENNRRRIALLEESTQLLYREWFVKLRFPGHELVKVVDGLPEGWERVPLSEMATVNSSSLSSKKAPETIFYIDIASVQTGVISQLNEMPFSEAPGRARRRVQHGDVIWSCVRPNRKSYSLIWEPSKEVIASTGFAVLTPSTVPFSYLYLATTTDDFVAFLTNRATGAAYPAVTAKDFQVAEILKPLSTVLDDFHASVEPLFALQDCLKKQNNELIDARDALLPKLMSGQLAV
jgi:type I restriction enzyme S subunit